MGAFLKKIIIIIPIVVLLFSFMISPFAEAASSKTQLGENEFYYAGTTESSYVVSQSFWDWLIENIGEIFDFLLGLLTMAPRMVFVGWAALFEEIITAMLEATMGVPMDIESDIDMTNSSGIIDSGNNVTLEAIFYNQIPALDINIFKNATATCVSGTGNYFIACEACYNEQIAEEQAKNPGTIITPTTNKKEMICEMQKCTCPNCMQELANEGLIEKETDGSPKYDAEGNPIRVSNAVTVIKECVSKWYYIMRLIAIIVMLCVLIAIGIKMAISTVGSDKALYRRMLFDWIAGMVLLFTIHYFMIVIIHLNEVIVDFISDYGSSSQSLGKEFLSESGMEGSEMEVSLYQAVRTRAYDIKMTTGTTGTIMYITLVFFTIRFVFSYLKRYLSIIILTLLAPGVAFSYAIQKALTGKSKTFGTWFHDYFTTVFLQTIHALVYTVFMTLALELAVTSIAGMVLALIFMKFILEVEPLVKKIFKLGGGSSDEASNAMESAISAGKTAFGIAATAKALNKSPITKAVKAPLKMARNGAILGASNAMDKWNKKHKDEKEQANKNKFDQLNTIANDLQELSQQIDPEGQATSKDFEKFMNNYNSEKDVISLDGQDAMEKQFTELFKLAASENITDEQREKLQQMAQQFENLTTFSMKDALAARLGQVLSKDNFYEYDPKTGKQRLKVGLLRGRVKYDRTQGKLVTQSMSQMIDQKLKLDNLLNLTKEDKALIKESADFLKGTLVGMGSLFVGLGTIVSNPMVGMGLLATGINNGIEFIDKTGIGAPDYKYRKPTCDEKQKRFSFKRFNKGAKQQITQAILGKAEQEKNKFVVENVRKNHKTLYNVLKIGGYGLLITGTLSGGLPAGIMIGTGVVLARVGKEKERYSGYTQRSLPGKIDAHFFKRFEDLKKKTIEDEIRLLSKDEEVRAREKYTELRANLDAILEADFDGSSEEEKQQLIEERTRLEEEKLRLEEEIRKLEEERQKAAERREEYNSVGAYEQEAAERSTLMELSEELNKAKKELENTEEQIEQLDVEVLESGEVLDLRKDEVSKKDILDENGNVKDDFAQKIMEEAVAKIVIERALSGSGAQDLGSEEIRVESEKLISKALRAHGVKGAIDKKVKNFSEKLEKAIKVTESELSASGGESTSDKASTFDEVLIETVIKEQVKDKKVKKLSDISAETITAEVKAKREKIISSKSSKDVISQIQGEKPSTDIPADFEENTVMSEQKEKAIRNSVMDVKRNNKPAKPKNENERAEAKKKAIAELDSILMAVATGEGTIQTGDNSEVTKSVDEVIQELFDNTADREAVAIVLDSIDNMKRLNRRGDNVKMKSTDPSYNQAKKELDRRKAFEKYPELISNADREYMNGDGRKNLEKETYGPVTDIPSLITEMSLGKK